MGQKYVIGLTGNIATGKSIVRRMLQELGASTVDADSLVHVLQKPGTAIYREIIETFGSFVLNEDATLNRRRLSDIAFNLPEALRVLEGIIHPAVRQQILRAIDKAPKYVVVIEAIKLIESGLADHCDAVWVVTAPEDVQMLRLVTKRKLPAKAALLRIQSQPSPAEKIARANVVVDNSGELIKTWNFVQKKFNEIPVPVVEAPPVAPEPVKPIAPEKAPLEIRRAKRSDLAAMADLVNQVTQGQPSVDEATMMERLFSKGYLVALQNNELLGMVGWQTENLIAGVDDFFMKSGNLWPTIGNTLLDKVEEEVASLSCEAGLIFLHNKTGPIAKKFLEKRDYQVKQTEELIKMWREAAEEWQIEDSTLMVRQLLAKRVMVPI